MRIEELSIGDWVSYDECSDPVQILGMDSRNGECAVMTDSCYPSGVIGFIENLRPIPLTPEILEKNGFEKLVLSDRRWENEELVIAAVREKEMGCWIICEADHNRRVCFEMCVENVHELQHIFRLVGVEREVCL